MLSYKFNRLREGNSTLLLNSLNFFKRLGDCKEGDWVYNSTADLCYVTEEKNGHRNLHYFAIESFCGNDTIVYPLTLYTKEIMDKIVYLRDDVDLEMLFGMSKPLLDSTIREIAQLYNQGEYMEPNKLERIKKELGYDIAKIASDIKIMSAEEMEALEE